MLTLTYMIFCQTDYFVILSLHFYGHFPGGPRLAGTKMSLFWIYWS